MKKVLILLLVCALLVAGCGKTAEPEPAPAAPVAEEPVAAMPEPEPEPEPVVEVDPKVESLLEAHEKRKIESITYLYTDPINDPKAEKFFVKGNKVKIELFDDNVFYRESLVDTVYLDYSTQSATAYCVDVRKCPEDAESVDVPFSDYARQTPFNWLDMVPDTAEYISNQQVDDRTVGEVSWEQGAVKYTVFIDEYYGMPLRVRIDGGSDAGTYYFKSLSINDVSDSEVTP